MKINLVRSKCRLSAVYFSRILSCFSVCALLASPSLVTAAVVSDDFESAATTSGSLEPTTWSQTYEPADDTTQKFLYQVVADAGVSGSQAVSIDTSAKSNYRVTNTTAVGSVGSDLYVIETQFQMTIGENAPAAPNQGVIALLFDTTENWFNGSTFGVTLLRRNGGKNYGVSGMGLTSPTGWEANSEIGLPNTLPATGETAVSQWFTIRFTMEDAGSATWNTKIQILDESGTEVFTHSNDGITITGMTPGDALHGRIAVPYVAVGGVAQTTPLSEGGVSALHFDNYSSAALGSAIDADGDGLTEVEEYNFGTSDNNVDSDGDSFSDFAEVNGVNGGPVTDPSDSGSYPNAPINVGDDFDTSALGSPPSEIWSSKWDGTNPSQQLLWTVGAANGVGGTQAYALDVTTASRNYHTIYQTAVTGDADTPINLSAEVSFSTTGALINETDTGGINGINDSFIGLLLTTKAQWWQVNGANGNFTFTVCRRQDDYWGFNVNGSVVGWLSNDAIGLAAGTTPSSSDWFTLKAVLDPNSDGSYTVICSASYEGTVLFTADPIDLPPVYAVNSPIYGGLTNAYNGDESNIGDPTGDDAVLQMPVGSISKVASVDIDNFSIAGYSESVDIDNDGLSQAEEFTYGTDDLKVDSDGDSFSDFDEVNGVNGGAATDPTDSASYLGAPVTLLDDFNDSELGPQETTLWNSKYDGNNPSQQQLWTVGADNGVGGTQGYTLDVAVASRNHHVINQTSVAGSVLNYSADLRFATTGAEIDETGTGGVNGINDAFIGLLLTTKAQWWQVNNTNGNFSFAVCRRGDDNWGFYMNGSVVGWLSNDAIGLEAGTTPSSSDWFTLNARLVPNSSGTAYEVVCSASYEGVTLFTSDPVELPAVYTIGGDIYAGFTSGFNGDPSNSGTPTGTDATLQMPVGSISKIASIDFDNFALVGYSNSVDVDGDNLSQSQEFILGTSDLNTDTDGDTFNDDTEVNAGTDPLDALDFPSTSTAVPVIDSFTFTDGNTVNIVFTGNPSTAYNLTQSTDLDSAFETVSTRTTDSSGSGTVEYVIPASVPTSSFFRIEEDLGAAASN
ncbi:thrombospondin type 3 repeat-containing protein [Puniceicoccaceae bacterium]|nr:thrombospondin type 3 repeat-containing protein [Puniceicoccaceae bacterium]